MNKFYLGIDTSCYTTSLAAVDGCGKVAADVRRLLPVQEGACGLAQSQAFFLHLKQVPELVSELYQRVEPRSVAAVCVSVQPRPQEESYMPVFRAGAGIARVIAETLAVPLYSTSHQEGHLMAALSSLAEQPQGAEFLAVHLSGGTGEILRVRRWPGAFALTIVGGCDLAPGQYIDRIGTALGLSFPAGRPLEELAASVEATQLRLPVAVRGSQISFTGPASAAKRLLEQGADPAHLARAVLWNVADALAKALLAAVQEQGLQEIVLAGGVMADAIIKERLISRLSNAAELFFAAPQLAGDNAVGVALLGRDKADQ